MVQWDSSYSRGGKLNRQELWLAARYPYRGGSRFTPGGEMMLVSSRAARRGNATGSVSLDIGRFEEESPTG